MNRALSLLSLIAISLGPGGVANGATYYVDFGAGADSEIKQDARGNPFPRDNAPDVGAYEYSGN